MLASIVLFVILQTTPLTHTVYLPDIENPAVVNVRAEAQSYTVFMPDIESAIRMSQQASSMLALIKYSSFQLRPSLIYSEILTEAAHQRALGLASGQPWAHCDPNGVCANDYARAAGCVLPDDYGHKNNIEVLVAGSDDALVSFDALMGSEHHRAALIGDGDFFRAQDKIGLFFLDAPGSPYHYYFVIMTAQCL